MSVQNLKSFRGGFVVIGLLSMALVTGAAFGPDGPGSATPKTITLTDGGRIITVSTLARTVGEALEQASVQLNPLDKVYPETDTAVADAMRVRITRVTSKTVMVREPVAHQIVRTPSRSLRPGHSKIVQAGKDGLNLATYRITFNDGRRVLKERISTSVIKKSVPMVVHYGQGSPMPSRGFYSRKVMTMNASAYDPGPRSCGKWATGKTAIGMKAGKGVVAVDPRVIPLGTKLYVEGYGFAVAGDTGGAIKGKRIDLGHNTYRQAIQFGRRKVVVHVLD